MDIGGGCSEFKRKCPVDWGPSARQRPRQSRGELLRPTTAAPTARQAVSKGGPGRAKSSHPATIPCQHLPHQVGGGIFLGAPGWQEGGGLMGTQPGEQAGQVGTLPP